MGRATRVATAAALLVTASIGFAPTARATGPDVCVGTGIFSLGGSLPDLPAAPATVGLWFGTLAGACAQGAWFQASGSLTGRCGLATGSGTDTRNHSFSISVVGDTATFTGQLTGVFQITDGPPCRGAGYFGTTAVVATASTCLVHDAHTTVPDPTSPGNTLLDVWTCA